MFYFSPISLWTWGDGTAPVAVATVGKHSMMPHQNMRRAMRRNRNRSHRFEALVLWLSKTINPIDSRVATI
jgi:hypothetical protein